MLLTIKEVAARLQIKPATLYAWAAQGRIPAIKIHRLVRFRREEIDQWLASFRRNESQPLPLRSLESKTDLDTIIARAKRQAYNPASRGNQTRSSPNGKEG